MAKDDDDKYKEGVDFEWVQGNNDDNSGFKTRRFFTRAEKKAKAEGSTAPKADAPKADAPKAKPKSADKSPTADQKPKKRPADLGIPDAPTSSPRPPKRPFVSKVAGRGGYAAGNAAGMPAKKLDSKVVGRGGYAAGPASGMPGSAKTTAGGARPETPGGMPGSAKTTTRGDRPGKPGGMPGSAKTTTRGDRPGKPGGMPGSATRTAGGARPEGKPATFPEYKMNKNAVRPNFGSGMPQPGFGARMLKKARDFLGGSGAADMEVDAMGNPMGYKKGGMIKEGSAKDMREDKMKAKKHDAPKKMAMGGKIKMVEKDGKKVPSFAADGVGKMAMGGAVKKMNYGGTMKSGGVVKKAGGGTMRGTGAAVRGKRFTGSR
jgi:hypothetical protein